MLYWSKSAVGKSAIIRGDQMPDTAQVNKDILKNRFAALNWSVYELAKQYGKIFTGEDDIDPRRFTSTVKQALENPEVCRWKTIEILIKAMDGELSLSWNKRENVITGQQIVKLDAPEDE
jgi:hypothetical protein